jgi:hypothetical protein
MVKDEGRPIGRPADSNVDETPVLETYATELVHTISLPGGGHIRRLALKDRRLDR